jgi:phosphate acetyltransferase
LSVQQIFKTRKTAEKVEAHLRQFGGATSNRTAGVLFMRTRGLSEETAQIPVAFDPSLRPTEEIAKFTTELQKYNRYFGSSDLPIIGLVPFSNTLSVPRTLDIASVIDGQWVNQGEAKHVVFCIQFNCFKH